MKQAGILSVVLLLCIAHGTYCSRFMSSLGSPRPIAAAMTDFKWDDEVDEDYERARRYNAEQEPKKEFTQRRTFLNGLFSGAVAGTTVDLILHPLDTVKTRIQSQSKLGVSMFKGLLDGIAPSIVASAPCAAVFFATYDTCKRKFEASDKFAGDHVAHMAAAACGTLTQSLLRNPFEVVKQRLQAGVDQSVRGALTNIMQESGYKGFYRGWTFMLSRDMPFDVIQYPLYEFLKKTWKTKRRGRELNQLQKCITGSVAGGLTAAITTPFDVAKTRMMTSNHIYNYVGVFDCIGQMFWVEGPLVPFQGIGPRVLQISIGGFIFFGAYEAAKKFIEQR